MLEKKEDDRCLLDSDDWKADTSGEASLGQNVPDGGLSCKFQLHLSDNNDDLGACLHSDCEVG